MKEHLKKYIDDSRTAHVRGLRILLEYFYATEIFEKITRNGIKIISVFGSARAHQQSGEYKSAHLLGSLLYRAGFAVVTGASRGIMQATNEGVADAIAEEVVRQKKASSLGEARKSPLYRHHLNRHSVGLSISLPFESESNPFVGVSATFHYFMVRKFFFGSLSSGFIACEGGWGTRDELYEILTLVQTGKAPLMPVLYLSPNAKHLEQDLHHALAMKYIDPRDLDLIRLVKTPQQAVQEVKQFYRVVDRIHYEREPVVRMTFKQDIPAAKRVKVEKILKQEEDAPDGIIWKRREVILSGYTPHSYGVLRRAVDLLNKV